MAFRSLWVVVLLLATAVPAAAQTQNKCAAGKKACIAKKVQQLLACHAAADKKGVPVDAGCIAKATARFDGGTKPEKGCFAKLEAKQNSAKPATVCPTTGDVATIEAAVDVFVDAIACQVSAGPCLPATGAGERCESAELIATGNYGDHSTADFVVDYDPCGLGGAFDGPDRVYAIVVPPGLTLTVQVNPTSGSDGASVALFEGLANCGAAAANQCTDVDTPAMSELVQVQTTNASPGTVTYYALVGSPGLDAVEYDLIITIND
jgi:hypothetical protein